MHTLEPASVSDVLNFNAKNKNNQKLRQQRKLKAAIRFQQSQAPSPSFPKYFLAKFPGVDLDTDIDVLGVDQDLKAKIGTPEEIKKHNRDTLMIKIKTRQQAESLASIRKLASYNVNIMEHNQMNQSKGTVYSEAMSKTTIDRLMDALADQNVVVIERMKTWINHELVDTHRYNLTFNQPEIPRTISLTNWHHELVEIFIPKPMRCTKCQRLGHTHKRCRSEQARCVQCGLEGHQMSQCENVPKCVNCGEAHRSSSNKCPVYAFKSEVLATQAKRKCTFREAEEQVKEGYREQGKQYSFVVKSKPPVPKRSPPNHEETRAQDSTPSTGVPSTASVPPKMPAAPARPAAPTVPVTTVMPVPPTE
ncbi:MAG: hypothetical protein AAFO91_15830, partial [Bacteroidota bacterium]